ncbi:MAG: hypothetical protein AMXMBFR23_07650 [Chloroflexota bacterium]
MEIAGSNPARVTSVCTRAAPAARFVPGGGGSRQRGRLYTRSMADTPAADPKQTYREAYADWQRHLTGVHDLLLEGKRLPPEQIKGLLNREARAKERYDAARRHLLGIEE